MRGLGIWNQYIGNIIVDEVCSKNKDEVSPPTRKCAITPYDVQVSELWKKEGHQQAKLAIQCTSQTLRMVISGSLRVSPIGTSTSIL